MLKFSEAILLGLPEIDFCNDYFLRPMSDGQKECSGCLAGAALYATGCRDSRVCGDVDHLLETKWPWMKKPVNFRCPLCQWMIHKTWVSDIASHFATHYELKEMSAEQIADFFRKMEPDEKEESRGTENDTVQRSDVVRAS